MVSVHTYLVTVADRKQEDLAASKEQLQAELDTTKRVSRAKDQQISRLQEDLWTMEEKMMQKQFSLVGEVAPEGTELCYTTLQFYKQIPSTVNVNFAFVVVRNFEPNLEV